MSEATVVAIVGLFTTLVAAIGGAWLGQRMQERREHRATRLRAYQELVALILESMATVDAARVAAATGRTLAARDDYRAGFGSDYFRAIALVRLVASPRLLELGQSIQDRVGELIAAVRSDPAADATAANDALMEAVGAFTREAAIDARR